MLADLGQQCALRQLGEASRGGREIGTLALHEGEVVFRDPILKEDLKSLGLLRKVTLGLGLVGSYQRNETVDVEYQLGDRTHLASDLPVIPE